MGTIPVVCFILPITWGQTLLLLQALRLLPPRPSSFPPSLLLSTFPPVLLPCARSLNPIPPSQKPSYPLPLLIIYSIRITSIYVPSPLPASTKAGVRAHSSMGGTSIADATSTASDTVRLLVPLLFSLPPLDYMSWGSGALFRGRQIFLFLGACNWGGRSVGSWRDT